MAISLKQLLLSYRQCPFCGSHTYLVAKDDQHELACEGCSWRKEVRAVSK